MAIFDKVWQQMHSHLDQTKVAKEIEKLRQTLQTKPNDTEALRQLGTLYETCNMGEDAVACFVKLASAYQQSGQPPLAIAYYRKAEKLATPEERASILKDVCKLHINQQQYEDGYRISRQIIEIYLSLNQKEAARGYVQNLPTFGDKDALYRKELREMIGEKDENWAQGAKGSWVTEEAPKPSQILNTLPGYTTARVPITPMAEKAEFAKMNVLIVDDDPGIIKLLGAMLKTIGCQVISANDGADGLAKAIAQHPDLIISDLLMPVMDGNQLFNNLQAQESTRDIPFICLTSRGQEEEKLAAFDKGVEDYWVKPFVVSELSMRVKKLLRRIKRDNEVSDRSSAELSGNLAEMSPGHILRMIEYLRKTGVLKFHLDNQDGYIFLTEGAIVDAHWQDSRGEEAILPLLQWSSGTFAFQSSQNSVTPTITSTLDELFEKLSQPEGDVAYTAQAEQTVESSTVDPNNIVYLTDGFYQSLTETRYPQCVDDIMAVVDGKKSLNECTEQLKDNMPAVKLILDLYRKGMIATRG